jgi:glucose/arabinose dehydrogenase
MFTALLLLCAHAAAATFSPAFGGQRFDRPVALVAGGKALYVVEQAGRVWQLQGQGRRLFADLSARVRTDNPEEGLLSVAFGPGDSYYAIYSVKGAQPRRTRLVRRFPGKDSEETVLEVTKHWGNHNGSTLLFGPDGALYVSLGDGGGAGDSQGNAQNPSNWLGKILRLDVRQKGPLPEIWALGLRNVWRMSFDPATGELWAGDVGQDSREEIDVIQKGGNYGWNWREGSRPYKSGGPPADKFIEPVYDYGRQDGISVTGGVVGRGKAPAWAQGRYLFADFGTRHLWSLDAKSKKRASVKREGNCPEAPSSFGTDQEGRIYVVGYEGGLFQLD